MIRVLMFGPLRDIAGWRERTIEPAPLNLSELKAYLAMGDPALGAALDGPGVRAAIDKTIIAGDAPLARICEVAFLPPMSGG